MKTSRSEYVVRNATTSLAMQIVKNILAFIGRTVFVYVLGAEYLGVNSLFTEILTMLSFAELGIGNAMVYSLYKPLAENDREKIKSLMKIYAKAYHVIGIVIAALGICVVPFLDYVVGDASYVKENITLLYLLFLLNSVLSYFFVYKKSLIIADQKNYLVDIYQQIFYAFQVIFQSVFLVLTRQFIPYLLINIMFTFLNNFFVAKKADKMYPCLTEKDVKPLDKKERDNITANVKALAVYKIGGIILESTDSIFISTIINLVTVGLYANYKMIINVFKNIGSQIMNSVIASVGNLNVSGDVEKEESVFYEIFYLNLWFFGFAAAGLCCFMTPFIRIWVGDSYVLGVDTVIAASVYFYVSNMHYTCYTYRTTAGLFVYGKYVPMVAAVISIILDVILGLKWGLAGIICASTIARIFTYEIVDPVLIFHRVFHKSVKRYFSIYAIATVAVIVVGFVSNKIILFIPFTGFLGFVTKVVMFSICYNGLFLLLTFKTKPAKTFFSRIRRIIKSKNSNRIDRYENK